MNNDSKYMSYPWGNNRPINLASAYTKKQFGNRLQKLTIDAGFTCPNRDGTISSGGCSFCNNNAFNPSYCNPTKSVSKQIEQGISFHKRRYKSAQNFLAYFQAYSNTYGTVDHLKKIYYEALEHESVIGLVIGTRPDCVDDSIFELLEEINKKHYLIVEYGVESVYNETLNNINRGHNFEKSRWAIEETHKRGIKTGAHFIFGLPGETHQMMLDSSGIISRLPLHSIKFHQLQIVRGTKIGEGYEKEPDKFKLYGLDEYIEFISEFLTRLNPDFIVERLAGETQPDYNLASRWKIRYDQVLQRIEKYMVHNNLWQGKNYRSRVESE